MSGKAYLFDTNAMIYHYREQGSKCVQQALDSGTPCFVSDLTVVEFRSTLAKLVRDDSVPFNASHFSVVNRRFTYETSTVGPLQIQPIRRNFIPRCCELIDRYGVKERLGLHSLDALQLTAALDLKSRFPSLVWITADEALSNVARREGIETQSPLA